MDMADRRMTKNTMKLWGKPRMENTSNSKYKLFYTFETILYYVNNIQHYT